MSSSRPAAATTPLVQSLAEAGGALLAAAFGATARIRGTRALHPVGVCGNGRLSVTPGPPSGVVVLDDPGPHECVLRWSRATGRQRGLDVEGLALRVDGPGRGDVLFASTGTGVLGRHLLWVRTPRRHGPVTTLLPLQSACGPLLLALDPKAAGDEHLPTAYRLLVSAPGHPWHERGRLDVTWTDQDCPRRHDPVGHPPVGLWTHPFWAALRTPSYVSSQLVEAREVTAEPVTGER
ncbi:hypothetical protein [Ornithinimicrobium pratense]|uniref:Phosphodiesterase n=1 Tax=Ornithinimicrobium pratense TaxID=2593973 RepID=A0A5J6V611_9MICO|nr:hypothetical protein [Ornithinimicrobium pratense]QFG68611.1 hypothetical protein FY030_07665 [Ornithinimicrobium pratense]